MVGSHIKKFIAQQKIRVIEEQLAELEALKAEKKAKPIEQTNDTYLEVTYADREEKLRKELEKYRKMLS
ncbi:MAG TPA: hypothetical protein VIH35_03945 [Kiritimatiellia bacterium]|jgi:hypothetical protein